MILECYVPFGNFVPGDLVTVPDDIDSFDHAHFRAATPAVAEAGE